MASSSAQKLKVLHLMNILRTETDPRHGLTMPQIIERLAARGVGAERFYRDDASRANAAGAPAGAHFGLGLSIVSDIVSAHGGILELPNLKDAQGNVIGAQTTATLPVDLLASSAHTP